MINNRRLGVLMAAHACAVLAASAPVLASEEAAKSIEGPADLPPPEPTNRQQRRADERKRAKAARKADQ